MSDFIKKNQDQYRKWPASKKVFLPKGRPPETGEVFKQPDLGRTMQYMADQEKKAARKGRKAGLKAARDAFYKGDIARVITKYIEKEGGPMRFEDFADFSVKFEPTVRARFDDIDLHACGPWSQGPVLPMALNILKTFDLKEMGHNSPEYIHVVTEALKLSFADRHHHFGDPRFVTVPMQGLMSDRYAQHRLSILSVETAWGERPPAGAPDTLADIRQICVPAPESDEAPGPRDTSYLCVVDSHVNAFSCTPSDGSDKTPIIPGVGVLCSGRGTQSWSDPTHACSVAP